MRAILLALGVGAVVLVGTRLVSAQRDGRSTLPDAARAANARLAGVWKLVDQETRNPQGERVPLARTAIGRLGYIAYDPAGYMAVTIQSPQHPKIAGPQPTPQEALAALGTYTSYWGSFAVSDAGNIVTHQTFGALSTAMSGTNQVRGLTIAGNRLTLRPPVNAEGNQPSLTWERVPDLPTLTPTHRKLMGFWKLISREVRTTKGELVSSSPGMTGFIVYTATGHVMVHMMQPYRRRNVGTTATPEEAMAAYQSYNSYFGPYEVNETEQRVVHHLAGVHPPNLVGTNFQRQFEIAGRRLVLKTPVSKNSAGETQTIITWERLSD